jgi:hypothetical protein
MQTNVIQPALQNDMWSLVITVDYAQKFDHQISHITEIISTLHNVPLWEQEVVEFTSRRIYSNFNCKLML